MKLPPLNAVRAFECAARHGSMRRAAEELFVTPGAVSQQIRLLEQHFGLALFERASRAVLLTSSGLEFYGAVTRHLRGIAHAADKLRPSEQQIAITVAPDFASRWLMPRLHAFAALHPKVEVRVDASFAVADFDRDSFDLGIRTLLDVPRGLHFEPVLRHRMQPFCSPAYHQREITGRGENAAWAGARLLHENHPFDFWTQWFAMKGLIEPNAEVGLYFSHGLLAIIAAVDGEGVTLQPPEYVERELATHALVAADPAVLTTGFGYYLVWPKRPLRPAAEKFRDWIVGIAPSP